MPWREIDRDASITWLVATPEFIYKLRRTGQNDHERTEIARYRGTPGAWEPVQPPTGPKIRQLTSVHDQLVVVDGNGIVALEDADDWIVLPFPAPVSSLVTGKDGDLFGLDEHGGIWAPTDKGDSWVQVDDLVDNDAIAVAGGVLYKRLRGGSIWRYTGVPMTGWQRVDNNSASVALRGGGELLLQIHDDSRVFQLPAGATSGWINVDRSRRMRELTAHGTRIFQSRDDGHVLEYTGTPSAWKDLGRPAAAGAVFAGPRTLLLYSGDRVFQNV
jgi:hypothetical protein